MIDSAISCVRARARPLAQAAGWRPRRWPAAQSRLRGAGSAAPKSARALALPPPGAHLGPRGRGGAGGRLRGPILGARKPTRGRGEAGESIKSRPSCFASLVCVVSPRQQPLSCDRRLRSAQLQCLVVWPTSNKQTRVCLPLVAKRNENIEQADPKSIERPLGAARAALCQCGAQATKWPRRRQLALPTGRRYWPTARPGCCSSHSDWFIRAAPAGNVPTRALNQIGPCALLRTAQVGKRRREQSARQPRKRLRHETTFMGHAKTHRDAPARPAEPASLALASSVSAVPPTAPRPHPASGRADNFENASRARARAYRSRPATSGAGQSGSRGARLVCGLRERVREPGVKWMGPSRRLARSALCARPPKRRRGRLLISNQVCGARQRNVAASLRRPPARPLGPANRVVARARCVAIEQLEPAGSGRRSVAGGVQLQFCSRGQKCAAPQVGRLAQLLCMTHGNLHDKLVGLPAAASERSH